MSARHVLALVALVLAASCTSIARPPAPGPDDVEVVLVAETCHKGLVLPAADGVRVEWGFGSFDWYALERNEWYRALTTVFWPSRGTLSRRVWSASEQDARRAGDCVTFRADRTRVNALARELQAAFDAARATRVWNEHYQTEFVASDESYWLFHDCHDETAEWLARLGCRVEPALVRLDVVSRPETRAAPSRD